MDCNSSRSEFMLQKFHFLRENWKRADDGGFDERKVTKEKSLE